MHARWCICKCVCYYVELRLILLLVMCISHRYGRQSTPEHNYLALEKRPHPQGKTGQRETVMVQTAGWDLHVYLQKMGMDDGSETGMRLHKKK